MSLLRIAWRSIQQRALSSALTAFTVALGVALVVAVLVIHGVIDQSFRRGSQGYDLIVGAKGSPLQLVLNTVFHLSQPIENIPYRYLEEFTLGRFAPAVDVAIPVCTGHDYKGFAVVATIPDAFQRLKYLDGREYQFAEGANFKAEHPFEAVIGSTVAKRLRMKLGDQFVPVAKVGETGGEEGHEPFTVVGILSHTGTPNDRALFVNLEGFYRCEAHQHDASFEEKVLAGEGAQSPGESAAKAEAGDKHGEHAHEDADHDHEHDEHRQLSAILLVTDIERQPQLAMSLPTVVNEEEVAQAVMPSRVIAELFDGIVGNVQLLLLVLAVLVVVVAGIGILVSIYNSMNDRRHEIAVMRALGARRTTVMSIILVESILLSLGGGALGVLIGHGLTGALAPTIAEQTGVLVSALDFQWAELVLVPGLVVLATLVGYLPALSAYRTDVAKALTSTP
ncbi:MAG: ABC transporter permease [Pirellulales bacterium]|nr:ABC transporter permease [Pirellulales bacterium]